MRNQLLTEKNFSIDMKTLTTHTLMCTHTHIHIHIHIQACTCTEVTQYLSLTTYEAREH